MDHANVGVSARECSYGGNYPALGVRAELQDVCVDGEYQCCPEAAPMSRGASASVAVRGEPSVECGFYPLAEGYFSEESVGDSPP